LKRLENESFISRAPEDIVVKEKEKLQGLFNNLEKLQKNLEALQN
jgi:valyl-tRNA synthetase